MHAYQPRRIVDAFTVEERVFGKPIIKRVRDREVKGKNWFEIVLVPGSVYDEIVKASVNRSLNVEPITLEALKKLNKKTYDKLMKLVLSSKTFILATSYSHPILPTMMKNSELDTKINLYWSLMYYYENFWRRLWEKEKKVPPIGFWFPECAYSRDVLILFFQVLNELTTSWGWTEKPQVYLVLDEVHGIGLDPSRIYVIKAGDNQCFAFFRYHSLSNTIAFESKLRRILYRFRREAERCNFDLIGVANDAECYGGNYDPKKPVMFERIRRLLKKRGQVKGLSKEKRPLQIVSAAHYLNDFKGSAPEVKINDYTAWSDLEGVGYTFKGRKPPKGFFDFYIGYAPRGLCRWTGLERNPDGTLSNRTYLSMFSWSNPLDKKTYVRIISSLWKVALNKIRDEAANFVRQKSFAIVQQCVKEKDSLEKLLIQYWVCALQKEGVEGFIERMIQEGLLKPLSDDDRKALSMTLQAYQGACQDAYISCPTFYSEYPFENETAWTSLAYSAAAFAKIANAFYTLNQMSEVKKVAEKYRSLFLDFDANPLWRELVKGLEVPFTLIFEPIKRTAKRRGYDLSKSMRLAKLKGKAEEELRSWALKASRELYDVALKGWIPLMPGEENPYLVLAEVYKEFKQKEKAEEEIERAKWYEWKKCIRSIHAEKNIVQRVGFLHAKHFPEYKRFLGISEEDIKVEIRTTQNLLWE